MNSRSAKRLSIVRWDWLTLLAESKRLVSLDCTIHVSF